MLKVIFIIGCPRSGTTILGEFFDTNSHCNYCHELDIWEENPHDPLANPTSLKIILKFLKFVRKNKKLAILLRSFQMSIRNKNSDENNDKGNRLDETDVTEDKIKKARKNLGEKILVVKNPKNSLRMPFIKKIFPEARFVHIKRDGRDVTSSLASAPTGKIWSFIKPPGWKVWKQFSSGPIRCAWQWMSTINIINLDKQKIPENDFIEIQYEDFIKDPENVMKELFQKLEIPFENEQRDLCKKVNNEVKSEYLAKYDALTVFDHKNRIGSHREKFSDEEIAQIEFILGRKFT